MNVTIIGGGASGLMAALTAAREGHRVLLLERQARVGRKLLATGNGRCNLTNRALSAGNYHGQDAAFAAPALEAFGPEETLHFFRTLGLLTVTEDSGRVYPLSDQAGSVVDVLRFAVEEAGVEVRAGAEVTALSRRKDGFRIACGEETLQADRVIVCCGGLAGGKLGGTNSGYTLLESLGHTRTALSPALVQVRTDPTFVRALKGVRADAAVRLCRDGTVLAESRGEVQFTDFGISGPAVFEISRAAGAEKGELTVSLDLLRSLTQQEVESCIALRCRTLPSLTTENLLTGILHNRLGRTVLRYAGFDLVTSVSALRAREFKRIAAACKEFTLPVQGVQGFDGAQVTAGGIRTAEFCPETLESRLVPGLYAAGEVLDIDGDCGGYNLQWAWSSGRLAGQLKSN